MSKSSIHDECQRRERELESLTEGQAAEITRLSKALDRCERNAAKLLLDIQKLARKGPE